MGLLLRAAALLLAGLSLAGCVRCKCPPSLLPPSLVSTPLGGAEWTVTEIGGQPIALAEGQRTPTLLLDTATGRFSGNAECNRMAGAFTRQAQNIRFTNVAVTRMACPTLDIETRFLAALDAVTSYRLAIPGLDLLDSSGNVRLRMVAQR